MEVNQRALLKQAVEESVCRCVLGYTLKCSATHLRDTWEREAESLCDQFPDIESIFRIEVIEATWKQEMERRRKMINLLCVPDGPEELAIRIIHTAASFSLNASEREVLDAALGDGWYDREPTAGRVKWIRRVREGLAKFIVRLDAGNGRRFAHNVLKRVKL